MRLGEAESMCVCVSGGKLEEFELRCMTTRREWSGKWSEHLKRQEMKVDQKVN